MVWTWSFRYQPNSSLITPLFVLQSKLIVVHSLAFTLTMTSLPFLRWLLYPKYWVELACPNIYNANFFDLKIIQSWGNKFTIQIIFQIISSCSRISCYNSRLILISRRHKLKAEYARFVCLNHISTSDSFW